MRCWIAWFVAMLGADGLLYLPVLRDVGAVQGMDQVLDRLMDWFSEGRWIVSLHDLLRCLMAVHDDIDELVDCLVKLFRWEKIAPGDVKCKTR